MSVPKYKRQQSKFELINKATAITAYTLKMCSNEKIFPKRYRWCITNKLVDTMLEMGKDIKIANSIKVSDSNDFAMTVCFSEVCATIIYIIRYQSISSMTMWRVRRIRVQP